MAYQASELDNYFNVEEWRISPLALYLAARVRAVTEVTSNK
jgi:hypothetical protein